MALRREVPGFAPAFTLVTGVPLTGGNHVEVLSNGDEIYARLWQDLLGTAEFCAVNHVDGGLMVQL